MLQHLITNVSPIFMSCFLRPVCVHNGIYTHDDLQIVHQFPCFQLMLIKHVVVSSPNTAQPKNVF